MWTGIDIGSYSIKLVQITRTLDGTIKVIGAARVNCKNVRGIEDYNAETVRGLRQIFQEGGIMPKNCIIGIAGRELNLRSTLSVPIKDTAILKKILEYEISEMAGNNISELYYDFTTLKLSEKNYTEQPVLVGLAKKSWIDSQMKFFHDSGIPIIDICPEPLALWFAYQYALNKSVKHKTKEETILLLDIGANNINAIIEERCNLIFARNITGVTFDPQATLVTDNTEQPDSNYAAVLSAMRQIHSIVEGSLAFCRTQLKREITINRVLISGHGASIRGFTNHLSLLINLPVESFNPFKTLDLSALNKEARETLREEPSDMIIALGLAQAEIAGQDKISLLPTSIKQKKRFYRETIYFLGGMMLMILLLMIVVAVTVGERQKVINELEQLKPQQEKIKLLKKQTEEAKKKTGKLESEYLAYFSEAEKEVFFAKTLLIIGQFLSSQLKISEITLGRFYQPASSYKTVYEPDEIVVKGYLTDDSGLTQLEQFYNNINNNNLYPLSLVFDQDKLSKIEGVSTKGKWEFKVIIKKR